MAKSRPAIRLRGVRQNNLKNFDLDLPLNQLIVVTGLSGSGKSSLAFDTLFAEGQRRYIETFSPYARQFFDRMDKPRVDSIEGIPPAIAIEQRNSVKSTRSTVGTMTEICDYMKLLWLHVAKLHCRQCGRPVQKDSPRQIWESLSANSYNPEAPLTPRPLPRSDGEGAGLPGSEVHGLNAQIFQEVPSSTAVERVPEGIAAAGEVLITFDVPLSEKLSLAESLALIAKQGYQRILLQGTIVRLDEVANLQSADAQPVITVIQDRLKPVSENRARFVEACEQAYHYGKGKLAIRPLADGRTTHEAVPFSNRLHCAHCDIEYREPSPALFSFNHPVGACPACRGFGRIITIDHALALPDRSKTLAEGVVKPWQTGQSAECQDDLMKFCKIRKVRTDVPFRELAQKWQDWVINGDPDYGKDKQHRWPKAWYGVKGYFRFLESKAYKMHVRVLLSRYRSYIPCPDCYGRRFQPEALLYKVAAPAGLRNIPAGSTLTLADFYTLSIRDALAFIGDLNGSIVGRAGRDVSKPPPASQEPETPRPSPLPSNGRGRIPRAGSPGVQASNDPLVLVLGEVRSRLGYLNDVGLGYLTLDRATRSLSGGETERVNLTTCLGTRLVNTLFVLDEPSVGLHPRDTNRLVRILEHLRNAGNTVVVVEHEASVMRAADQIIDLGPGHGALGGELVFQGTYTDILKSPVSLTGKYLSGRSKIELPKRRDPGGSGSGKSIPGRLTVTRANLHNLKDLTVEIPLGLFVCITGVSGSGKSTLVRDILLPLLNSKLAVQRPAADDTEAEAEPDADGDIAPGSPIGATTNTPTLRGWEALGSAVLVDQSILAKTPRSNPAVYTGAFDEIRELFAQSELAHQRGLNASAFSFNSAQGQCERCRGAGFEKIEMQFLTDVFIRCPECQGRRYRSHILEIKIGSKPAASKRENGDSTPKSIGDVLESTVDEAVEFLRGFGNVRPAVRALACLNLLQEVGLGYLQLGQPINTLSGGESQRLKLVRHLGEFKLSEQSASKPTLFLFDEPTTGLHFDDVRVLLQVFQRLVDAGHSVVIIEHNLDVIKSADWLIDLGPDAGEDGGRIVAQGTPEHVAGCAASHTGSALAEVLRRRKLS